MTNAEENVIKSLLKFEYNILSDLYIPNSKNKTQLKISKRMDEILKMLKL